MNTLRRLFVFLLTGATASFATEAARAEAPKSAAWWVETRPWTCSDWTGPLARELQISCDAVGGCRIAADERSADRRAIVHCNDDGWVLEAQGAAGQKLWTLELDGEEEDRLRKAAVWIARSERSDIAATPLPSLTPIVTTPAPAPAVVPAPTPTPVPAHEPIRTADVPEVDAVPGDAAASSKNTIALSLHSNYAPGTSEGAQVMLGGRVQGAHALTGGARLGLALEFDQSAVASMDYRPISVGRAGVLLGWGAPWSDDVVGIAGEGGIAVVSREVFTYSDNLWGEGGRDTVVAPHIKGAITAQWPRREGIRPFLTASCTALWVESRAWAYGGLDLGVAWNAF